MARICLPREERDALLKVIKKDRSAFVKKLYKAGSSSKRRKILEEIVGDHAKTVNARFEQSMASNQRQAFKKFLEQSGQVEIKKENGKTVFVDALKEPIRRDFLKRLKRNEKFIEAGEADAFLEDVVEAQLGVRVSEKQATKLLKLAEEVDIKRANIPENYTEVTKEGLDYGAAVVKFNRYSDNLMQDAEKLGIKEYIKEGVKLQNIPDTATDVGNLSRALVASVDNSFPGRQGIPVLATNPTIYIRNTAKSIRDFTKTVFAKSESKTKFGILGPQERSNLIKDAIDAEIIARPNNINGKYKASKNGYGLGVMEESIPTSLPETFPGVGRAFHASETAFTGTARRMRADLADYYIDQAEKAGLDMLDEKNATALGNMITSLTGRGELDWFAASGNKLNAILFSPRFIKANWNVLTMHLFDKRATPFVKKQAAYNLLKMGAVAYIALKVAKATGHDAELDPRASNFGMVKINNNWIDITGGERGLIRLIARLATKESYSNNTRTWTELNTGDYFGKTGLEETERFVENKFSPLFGLFRDMLRGENFEGEKPNVVNTTLGLVTPISVEMALEESKKGNDGLIAMLMAEAMGFSPSSATYRGYGKKWDTLKAEVDTITYNKALRDVGEKFTKRADALEGSSQWSKLTKEEQKKKLDKIRSEETDRVLRKYGIR